VLALTQGLELVFLFLILPFVVAAGVIWFVSWRNDTGTPPLRTSQVLASGTPATARVTAVKMFANFLDARPMVHLALEVELDGSHFALDVTQSFPRMIAKAFRPGDTVEVRVSADRQAGAVVVPEQ
jgi:hypothetical protein